MPKRWLLLPITALTCISADLSSVPSRSGSQSSAVLKLDIKADRGTYKMSDNLRLETRITNVGEEDVYIREWDLCWNPALGLSMRIVDAHGKEVHTQVLWDCLPPPPHEGDVYEFFKLPRQRFYGRTDDFPMTEMVNDPGAYDIAASFRSFSSSEWITEYLGKDPIAKLPVWTIDRPPIISNTIHIVVKP